jgi:cytochrome c
MMARVIVKVLVTTVTVLTLGPISSVADELTGEALYGLACAACHNPGVQVDHRVGPPLGKLNQRKAGSVEGYEYSAALSASTIHWNRAELTGWILDSDQRVPGSRMVYNNQLTIDEIQRLTIWLLAEQVK